MNDDQIQVPRDANIGNKRVTKDIEAYLLDLFSANSEDAYTYKELSNMVKRKFSSTYGDDLKAHTAWAVDMLHYNSLIKRVAPGTFESVDGPDDVYTERETGHSPEGEFSNRGKNLKGTRPIGNRKEFNAELSKCMLSVKMLKNMGYSKEKIISDLPPERFNPVALKIAIKHHFEGADADTTDVKLTQKGSTPPTEPTPQ